MTPALHFAANFWWLVFPLGGAIGGGLRAIAAANERRAERRLERYRLKQQAKIAVAQASGRARTSEDSYRRELAKLIAAHDGADARWLDYEVDIAKLLDFPMMTDMRAPLTITFHKAKRRADLLRPERPKDLVGDRDAQLEYRNAVHEYIGAFEIAEAEAIRRRRSDFSADEQQRLARAQAKRLCTGKQRARGPHRAAGPRKGQHRAARRRADRGLTPHALTKALRLLRSTLQLSAAPTKTTPTEAVATWGIWSLGSTDSNMITASAPIAQCAPCSRYT